MRKLLLTILCFTSINAFADYQDDYRQGQYQEQSLRNQEEQMQQMKNQQFQQQADRLSREWEMGQAYQQGY